MEPNYLSNEIMSILEQRARRMRSDVSNRMFWRLFIMLIPFLIYSISLHAEHNGAAWKCENCRVYQWQHSCNKDWKGNYKCNVCGAQK